MARTAITATRPTEAGVAPPVEVAGDTVNGNYVTNDGRTIVTVRNADAGGAHSVTFVTSVTVGGKAVADQVVSIPASTTKDFSAFAPSVYGSALGIDVDSAQLMLAARQS